LPPLFFVDQNTSTTPIKNLKLYAEVFTTPKS